MTRPIALQLYTVRDALAQDFEGTVRRVAEIGYAGVEPAGFPGTTAREGTTAPITWVSNMVCQVASVCSTNGARIWLIGVGLGLLALAAIFVALRDQHDNKP